MRFANLLNRKTLGVSLGALVIGFTILFYHLTNTPLLRSKLLFLGRAVEPPSDRSVGTTDVTGELIIHVFGPDSKRPARVRLSTPYGIMMFRTVDGGARFTFADQAKKSVREFDSYDDFLKALAELPKGSTLTIYDRCTMPLLYDFYPVHQELYQKFSRDCRKRGLKVADEEKITCTCGTEGW